MKTFCAFLFLVSVAVVFNSCAGNKQILQHTGDDKRFNYAPLWAAMYQQKASEYKALTLQAYNIAYERLDGYIKQQAGKPQAVITDIDETVLDNSPYTVHQALLEQGYSDNTWKEWTARVDCDTVPGALSFFKYAASKKVEVFYISNRLKEETPQTLANLRKWNFPFADEAHLLLKTTTSSKDARRAQVRENYNVLMLFGDNLGDFEGIYDKRPTETRDSLVRANTASFGSRFIVLPNPMYGEWMNALIHYHYTATPQLQADTATSVLKNY